MQAAVCLGENRAEKLFTAVGQREYRLHERQRRLHAERAGVQELPEVHDREQYFVREVGCREAAGCRGRALGQEGEYATRLCGRSEEHTSELQSRQYLV